MNHNRLRSVVFGKNPKAIIQSIILSVGMFIAYTGVVYSTRFIQISHQVFSAAAIFLLIIGLIALPVFNSYCGSGILSCWLLAFATGFAEVINGGIAVYEAPTISNLFLPAIEFGTGGAILFGTIGFIVGAAGRKIVRRFEGGFDIA